MTLSLIATRSSAIAYGSRDAPVQWKYGRRVHDYTKTSGSAMAEGPRDALVSKNSATYKTSHLKTRVSGLSCGIICRRTDGRTDTRRRHVPHLA